MKKIIYIFLIFFCSSIFYGCNKNGINSNFHKVNSLKIERVAHAGGSYKNYSYTNSLEALNFNIKKGVKFFELDFSFTADNQIVCLHDWGENFFQSFGFNIIEKPTLENFKTLVKKQKKYHNLTLDDLATWLKKNPKAMIITDFKDDNLKGLKIITKSINNYANRVIPQIYQPDEYNEVKKLGYKHIIWTLYRYPHSRRKVLRNVYKMDLFAVTFSSFWADQNLGNILKEKNISTYIHTINSEKEKTFFMEKCGVTEIYSDSLFR